MDEPHRKPGERDRGPLAARIKRAADDGRIASADRDIRLSNVASAQSMAELDLIARDLDQLESALPAAATTTPAATPAATPTAGPAVGTPAWTGPSPAPLADKVTEQAVTAARTTVRSVGVVTILILVVLGIGGGAAAFFTSGGSDDAESSELFTPEPIPTDATDGPVDDPSGDPPGADPAGDTAYGLNVAGIRWFLDTYRAKFGTTLVVDLVMYGDYAVVEVPQAGKKRHTGFLYRRGEGWQEVVGVRANTPGAELVDVSGLDVPALVRNIAKAQRTLNVEDVSQTYAIVHDYSPTDDVPSVDIHVSNEYGESGYLATSLDGTVERAYPFTN